MNRFDILTREMIAFDAGQPDLIHHFLKVHQFAKLIGAMEAVSPAEMEVLEAAAIVHDIGIKICMEKYGNCNGKLQEQEGPAYAQALLKKNGFRPELIDRVGYLVAHHHTYANIDGNDYQILVEADFLVNLYEGKSGKEAIQSAYRNIFKTASGKELCRELYAGAGDLD